MDAFKTVQHVGPGGVKCPCCVDANKKRRQRNARARVARQTRDTVRRDLGLSRNRDGSWE